MAIYSSNLSFGNWASWSVEQCICWVRIWFLWVQMDQVSMENNSRFLSFLIIQQFAKILERNVSSKVPCNQRPHAQSKLGTAQIAWIGISKGPKQWSQVWLDITLWRTKLHLVGSEFSQALQIKCLTLFREFRDQIFFFFHRPSS